MFSVDGNLADQAIHRYIEHECVKIGPVQLLELFLKPARKAKPFAFVYKMQLERAPRMLKKFGALSSVAG
jgi:hypothetical protein